MYKDFKILDIMEISGLKVIEPDIFEDHRGSLFTTFLKDQFIKMGITSNFIHDKIAFNISKGILRGIHGDFKSWKLVTVLNGSVFQVVVDNRIKSETYLNKFEINLNSKTPKMLLIPPGCGNGFQTLEDNTVYNYKLSYNGNYSDADDQFTIPWDSDDFRINWPNDNPILSKRDKNA